MIYSKLSEYQSAYEVWYRKLLIFEQVESARIASVERRIKSCQTTRPIIVSLCLLAIGISLYVGAIYGSEIGIVFLVAEIIPTASIISVCGRLERWLARKELVRQQYGVVQPTYDPGPYQPPPPRQEQTRSSASPPPRRAEARSGPEPSKTSEPAKIDSLRTAFAILELPPGRVTLSQAKAAYRSLMSQYHPDRCTHLGLALRELAAQKSLQINLAYQFIENHITK